MRRSLATILLIVSLAAGAVGCADDVGRDEQGQATESATADVFSLKVGDCTGALKDGDISQAEIIPCAQKHYYEAYAKVDMTDASFPGSTKAQEQAQKFCTAEFKKFVGVSTSDSKYSFFYLSPTSQSWNNGDREILCLAGNDKGGITGSLKGVKK